MLRSVVPANPAAFLNKSDSQRKRFGGYIPIGKSPEHGFIFFLLFLFKSGGSNGIHRLRNQSVMFQCAFKQNAGRTVNSARRQVRRSVPVSFGQFPCNAKALTALCHACELGLRKPYLFGSAASIDVVFILFSPRSLIARSCPVKIR